MCVYVYMHMCIWIGVCAHTHIQHVKHLHWNCWRTESWTWKLNGQAIFVNWRGIRIYRMYPSLSRLLNPRVQCTRKCFLSSSLYLCENTTSFLHNMIHQTASRWMINSCVWVIEGGYLTRKFAARFRFFLQLSCAWPLCKDTSLIED